MTCGAAGSAGRGRAGGVAASRASRGPGGRVHPPRQLCLCWAENLAETAKPSPGWSCATAPRVPSATSSRGSSGARRGGVPEPREPGGDKACPLASASAAPSYCLQLFCEAAQAFARLCGELDEGRRRGSWQRRLQEGRLTARLSPAHLPRSTSGVAGRGAQGREWCWLRRSIGPPRWPLCW